MNRELLTECRTVLKRCEGALQGVLDYVPSKLAADILREVIAIVGRIDKQTSKEHVDGFLIRALESIAEGLEKGGSPASATRELRRLLAGVEDCSDETTCKPEVQRFMDIESAPGTKVVFAYPNNGYGGDRTHAAEHLKVGETYTVKYTSVGQSHSSVYLHEIPNTCFNTVQFAPEGFQQKAAAECNGKCEGHSSEASVSGWAADPACPKHGYSQVKTSEVTPPSSKEQVYREALECLLPGLVLDLRYAGDDDDKDAMQSRVRTVTEALAYAPSGETRDVTQCEPYLKALTRYIDGVYGMAMEHGVPAKDAAFHAKHMQDAVLGLRRILNLPAVSQLCSDGKHEWCMNRSKAESHCQCDCHRPAVKTSEAAPSVFDHQVSRWKCVSYCRCTPIVDGQEHGHFERTDDGVWVRHDDIRHLLEDSAP
jgi:hypothetical protein